MYTACWLLMRPQWINLATHRKPGQPYPEPQDWKDFLSNLYAKIGLPFGSLSSLAGPSTSHAGSSAPQGR